MDHVNVPAKFEVCCFTRSWDNSAYLKTLGSTWICRSRSPKVTDFGTNRKRVIDFLLVRHSNLGHILHALYVNYCTLMTNLITSVQPLQELSVLGSRTFFPINFVEFQMPFLQVLLPALPSVFNHPIGQTCLHSMFSHLSVLMKLQDLFGLCHRNLLHLTVITLH